MLLFDANVLLELMIPGREHKAETQAYMDQLTEPFCVTMLSVHLVLHFGFKAGLSAADIKQFLSDYPKVALLPEDYTKAMDILRDKDSEDSLQLAVAERIGCSAIVTLDKKFAASYHDRLKFISPLTWTS